MLIIIVLFTSCSIDTTTGKYPAPYNLTDVEAITNISSPLKLMQNVNDVFSGWFFTIFLVTLLATLFVAMKSRGNDTKDTIEAVSFFGMVLSIIMKGMNVIPTSTFWVLMVLLGLVAFFWVSKDSY